MLFVYFPPCCGEKDSRVTVNLQLYFQLQRNIVEMVVNETAASLGAGHFF